MCARQSSLVEIHPSRYVVGYNPGKPVALGADFFAPQKDFIERWGKFPGVLRIHHKDPNESTARHHAFYIDVGTLMEIPEFRNEVVQTLQALNPRPDLIVAPDHPTARKVAQIAADALAVGLVMLASSDMKNDAPDIVNKFTNLSRILVIDDVFITGARLKEINRFFRQHQPTHIPNLSQIYFWTILATPSSEIHYRQLVTGLTTRHAWVASLAHQHKVILPDWHDADHCPWCNETKVLTAIAQVEPSALFEGPLARRLGVLKAPKELMANPLFVFDENARMPKLGGQSVVLEENSTLLQVLFACASAIQQLRQAQANSLNADQFPAPAFFADRNFSNNYTERLIWLGLLRSLKGKEFDPLLREFLSRSAHDAADADLGLIQGELVISWLVGKLGPIPANTQSEKLFSNAGISWNSLLAKAHVDKHPARIADPSLEKTPHKHRKYLDRLFLKFSKILSLAKRLFGP